MKLSSTVVISTTISAMRARCLLWGVASLLLVQQMHFVAGNYYGDYSEPHECLRTCTWPPEPRICRYEFTLEWYHTMSAACYDCPFNMTDCYRPHCIPINGVLRAINVVNRQFPGPSIDVCEFDTIEVKVRNNLINSEGIAIHWHGIHQRGTPHMDGVPLVTQCPIPYRASFTYKFKAETVGTFFWHAHGIPRAEGAVGPLVVRQAAPDDVHSSLYDFDLPEHTIIVQDWVHQLFIDRFAKIVFYDLEPVSDSILINGRGRYTDFMDPTTNETIYTPKHVVHVQKGNRYRFRVISNSVMECPFDISIDNHNLTVIASDGAPVQPLEVEVLGLTSGERYDFILDAQAGVGKYWLRVKGLRWCEDMQELALVVYEGASDQPDPPEMDASHPVGLRLNPFDMESSATVLNANDMVAAGNEPEIGEADAVYYVNLNLGQVNNNNYNHPVYYPAFVTNGNTPSVPGVPSPQINHVSFRPPTAPLLTQSRDISEFEICTFTQTLARQEHCKVEFCECTHVLEVELGQVVELVLVDAGLFTSSHPMHVHGYRFQILARGIVGETTSVEEVMRLDQAGNITRRTLNAPSKDTVVPPDGGYIVVRFIADNPGWWLFHCHVELHFQPGMTLVIHVGSDDDLPPMPSDLPRCGGDWYPNDDLTASPTADAPGNVAGIRQGGVLTSSLVVNIIVTMLALIWQY